MNKIKIGIVEDEGITVEIILRALGQLNYTLTEPASNYDQAIKMIEKERPDFLLIDIKLGKGKDGIELANYVKNNYDIPFIFITANSDTPTLIRAKSTTPLGFLVKPFTQIDLYTSIEIAFNLYSHLNSKSNVEYLFLKVKKKFEKIKIDDILFLENNLRYIIIHFADGNSMKISASSKEILEKLPSNKFIQINRTYIVNARRVEKIDSFNIQIGEHLLLFKTAIKNELIKMLIN